MAIRTDLYSSTGG